MILILVKKPKSLVFWSLLVFSIVCALELFDVFTDDS